MTTLRKESQEIVVCHIHTQLEQEFLLKLRFHFLGRKRMKVCTVLLQCLLFCERFSCERPTLTLSLLLTKNGLKLLIPLSPPTMHGNYRCGPHKQHFKSRRLNILLITRRMKQEDIFLFIFLQYFFYSPGIHKGLLLEYCRA